MRKDCIYKQIIHLKYHLLYAQCGYPVGNEPTASCKHIVMVLIIFVLVESYQILLHVQKLQECERSCGKKVPPIPVEDYVC